MGKAAQLDLTPEDVAHRPDGVGLVAFREGLRVFGWFDGIVGIDGFTISWTELEAIREKLRKEARNDG